MTQPALFELDPAADRPELTTPGERRRSRVDALIAAGTHPLSTVAVGLRLAVGPSLTCGSCAHRWPVPGGARTYPKCDAGSPPGRAGRNADSWPRATSGIGTDVKQTWPACTTYEHRST